jgi:hypothetical protein
MNAEPLLDKVAKVLSEHRMETVVVGNASAALHGAPVTTTKDCSLTFWRHSTAYDRSKLSARVRHQSNSAHLDEQKDLQNQKGSRGSAKA